MPAFGVNLNRQNGFEPAAGHAAMTVRHMEPSEQIKLTFKAETKFLAHYSMISVEYL